MTARAAPLVKIDRHQVLLPVPPPAPVEYGVAPPPQVGSLAGLHETGCFLCTWVPEGSGFRLKHRNALCMAPVHG
jgi:hypothetical protein